MVRGPSPTIQIFNKYVKTIEGVVDASGIFTKPCYLEWLAIRKSFPKDPEHAFRKAVTGHCRGDCGLKPFEPEIEEAVLKILRRKQVWACFHDSKVKIGSRGFQTQGYWEMRTKGKKRDRNSDDTSVVGSVLEDEQGDSFEKPPKKQKCEVSYASPEVFIAKSPKEYLTKHAPFVYPSLPQANYPQVLFGPQFVSYLKPNTSMSHQILAHQLAWQQYAFNSLLYGQLS